MTADSPVKHAVVVIPARDEEERIGACLEALGGQSIGAGAFGVILVADACRDGTEAIARAQADRMGLDLEILSGPGRGTGPARRLGMDAAMTRLLEHGLSDGLIATTDADSQPATDWLERQLAQVAGGAQVIAGRIELLGEESERLPAPVLERRRLDAQRRMHDVLKVDPSAEHHHFAGASLGITAGTYRAVGGIDAPVALEDEVFARKLRDHGIPILRSAAVSVQTTARTHGRARRGLSVDLAVSLWQEHGHHNGSDFTLSALAERRASVTVIVPTRDCAGTIAGVLERTIEPVRRAGGVDRVIVVDAASTDGTEAIARAAGAEVLQQDTLLESYGPTLGKGDAMWRALSVTDTDIVCFLDGDTEDPVPVHLIGLLGPILADERLTLVKGAFERPLLNGRETLPHEGGRVTELTARPLLNLHFPLLAGFSQPLAGEFSARRSLLEQLSFPVGYGVEVAMLIDALSRCGLDALAESHIGTRQNRHQPLRSLSQMSFAVLTAVERRLDGPRSVTSGHYLCPWDPEARIPVPVEERPPLATLSPQRALNHSSSAPAG